MKLKNKAIYVFIGIVFLLNLLHLNKVPIAWIDEIMLIDPAWNFLKTGAFAGKVWPHEGAETIFLAYLPLGSFLHFIDLSIFPKELFYTRLPWLIYYIGLCIFVYKYILARYMHLPSAALLFIALFIVDECINNSLRNGRIEMPSMLIIAALFYLNIRNIRPSIQAVLLSLLFISHPGFYPIGIVLSLNLLTKKASIFKRLQYILIIGALPFFYLYMADFNFQTIYEQLVLHGREHDETVVPGQLFYNHFIGRFLPIYKYQFWMIGLNILAHIYCLYVIIFRWNPRVQVLEWAFLFTSVFWYFNLAPFNRYTSILTLMTFLLLPGIIQRILSVYGYLRVNLKIIKPLQIGLFVLVLGLCSANFFVRHFTIAQQWNARNEYKVYDWLDQHVPKDKNVLIIDEAVGFYYAMQHENVSFTLPYALHKYRVEQYDKIYYLTLRDSNTSAQLINTYSCKDDLKYKLSNQKILTYNGLKLYEIKSDSELKEIWRK